FTVLPKQNGEIAIVTGGAKGLGYETVRQLTNLGVYVIIGKDVKIRLQCLSDV
uniref:Uncharacterized protein n=1 Tax=Sinocyclocheilus anshuiensis TaxID=1608454 RepID=A0A671LJZ1_9TELE